MKYHYVYRITNIIENKHYYGVRTTKTLPKLDLGIKYFSSSRDLNFISDQKKNSKDYKYKIISIFNTRKDAINMEIKLHHKFNVGVNESFYNLSKQTSYGFDRSGITYNHSEETKIKIGNSNKGKYVTQETRDKLSNLHKGKEISQEHRDQISKKLKGVPKPDEFGNKVSNALKNKSKSTEHKDNLSLAWKQRKTVMCPHCNKESQNVGMMNKWHFDNCKFISLKA